MDSKIKIILLSALILIIIFSFIGIKSSKNKDNNENVSENVNIVEEDNGYTIYDESGKNIIAQNITEDEMKMYIENPNYSLDPRNVK